MDILIDGFYDAKADARASKTMKGVGITPEGIENNPVMYELLYELPWREQRFTRSEWLKEYVQARYATDDATLHQAWQLLHGRSQHERDQSSCFKRRAGLRISERRRPGAGEILF